MAPNEKLAALSAAGVSIWLDDLSRERLTSGNLQELITDKSVVGVTTIPAMLNRPAEEIENDRKELRRLIEQLGVAGHPMKQP
jgi:transaldolase